jgi:hypothetical protein
MEVLTASVRTPTLNRATHLAALSIVSGARGRHGLAVLVLVTPVSAAALALKSWPRHSAVSRALVPVPSPTVATHLHAQSIAFRLNGVCGMPALLPAVAAPLLVTVRLSSTQPMVAVTAPVPSLKPTLATRIHAKLEGGLLLMSRH